MRYRRVNLVLAGYALQVPSTFRFTARGLHIQQVLAQDTLRHGLVCISASSEFTPDDRAWPAVQRRPGQYGAQKASVCSRFGLRLWGTASWAPVE